ncbi:MAG: multidrug ABC transporter ATP-binding protein [Euryarchaeota archaeon RBG_16_62_10]|nr:MAG: multidrug ABC transporter ATP-binding protein [Euryarchaeota archaeon RBG_16_62_10]
MIETIGLGRKFNGKAAVDDLNLKVEKGEVFGLLGPNGAGKTTTIRMLSCLIGQTSGTAFVNGYEINKEPDQNHIRKIVGLLPESPGLYDSLSAHQNLDFFAQLYGVPKGQRGERIEELLRMLGVWERKDEAVATYSKGMKQKIAIARAFVHSPEVVFLDEPTAGLDPEASLTVREFLINLKGEGRTVFINSHHLDEVERLCDRIAVMNQTALAVGSPKELAARYWGRTTVVELVEMRPLYAEALRGLPFASNVRVDDGKLLVDVDDPELRNPSIVESLARAGARIEYVTELKRTLEDVYMKLIRGGAR